jgi:hypothetical protein
MNPVAVTCGRSESPDRSRHTDTGRAWRLGPDQSQERPWAPASAGVLKIRAPVW